MVSLPTLLVTLLVGGLLVALGVTLGTMLGGGGPALPRRRPAREAHPEEPHADHAPLSPAKLSETAGVAKAVEVGAQHLMAEYRAVGQPLTPREARRRAALMLGASDGMED